MVHNIQKPQVKRALAVCVLQKKEESEAVQRMGSSSRNPRANSRAHIRRLLKCVGAFAVNVAFCFARLKCRARESV